MDIVCHDQTVPQKNIPVKDELCLTAPDNVSYVPLTPIRRGDQKMTQSRDYLLGRIQGLMDAKAMASEKPTAYAFNVRSQIEDELVRLRTDLVERKHD